jgi:[NiFe] hydrogenase assembly HybE family chaperone
MAQGIAQGIAMITDESPPAPLLQRGVNPAASLEAVFRHIAATRMAGVSILNPALDVEAVGFRLLRDDWVGVLVTPWFMSLICLPGPASAWEPRSSGSKQDVELPSGSYEFLTAHEDELGAYLTSSLFSPMFEFQNMEQARDVATAALAEMFAPAQAEAAKPEAVPAPAPLVAAAPTPPVGLVAKLEQPVSRRGFFSAFLRAGDKS